MNILRKYLSVSLVLILLVSLAPVNAAEPPAGDKVLSGKVINEITTNSISGATVSAVNSTSKHFTAISDINGTYSLELPKDTYVVTCSADGYEDVITTVVIKNKNIVQDFILNPNPTITILSLTATPSSFTEGTVDTVSLNSTIDGTPSDYNWTQIAGPSVSITPTSAYCADVNVSNLDVLADTDLFFELNVSNGTETATKQVNVHVLSQVDETPVDVSKYMRIGGSTDIVTKFENNGIEWALYNTGGTLKATPISTTKDVVHSVDLPGYIHDILVVNYSGMSYAIVAGDSEGIIVVDINDPSNMNFVSATKLNYYFDGVNFTEGGGAILYDNNKSGTRGPAVALETDGTDLYIANHDYGIQKTALANVLNASGPVLEVDETLKIDSEKLTLLYAGEKPWGQPNSVKLHNGKLFVTLSELGFGIFDPDTLEQVGGYNLYTDTSFNEDYFGNMNVSEQVSSDPGTSESYLDDFTGMPDYRQVNFEILQVWKDSSDELTPWADFDRYGKFYYIARTLDIAEDNGKTIAYVAYALGGVVAVNITGYDTANSDNMLTGTLLGFFPAAPTHGMITTGSDPSSFLPFEGAGILKESGFTDIKVSGDNVYVTEHFGGLIILDQYNHSNANWNGSNSPYDNDDIEEIHDPEFENIISYNMSPSNPLDDESLPVAYYDTPVVLTTEELYGHGKSLMLMDTIDLENAGSLDVLECSGAGGLIFVDINLPSSEGFEIVSVYPTTDEIGAAPDGSPIPLISLGHTMGVDASSGYLYVSDGPNGVSAWELFNESGNQLAVPQLVANTLQEEFPVTVDGVTIYPASHSRNVVFDPIHSITWSLGDSSGLRKVPVLDVENGVAMVGAPLHLNLTQADCYEHNADWGNIEVLNYQDHAYDVVIKDNYAYVADGSNGLTVWDITKTLEAAYVSNIGATKEKPAIGRASGVRLWTNNTDGKVYAFMASGPYGIGVVDVTDPTDMELIKVFEPRKFEDEKVIAADGKAVSVEVVGNVVYLTYDSFGFVTYNISDLIKPLPPGIDPTQIWKTNNSGTLMYDHRPDVISRFKLQYLPEYADWDGAALRMDYRQVDGNLIFYIAYGTAGAVCLDMTDPATPELISVTETVGECIDVEHINGVLYCADGFGGIAVLR